MVARLPHDPYCLVLLSSGKNCASQVEFHLKSKCTTSSIIGGESDGGVRVCAPLFPMDSP